MNELERSYLQDKRFSPTEYEARRYEARKKYDSADQLRGKSTPDDTRLRRCCKLFLEILGASGKIPCLESLGDEKKVQAALFNTIAALERAIGLDREIGDLSKPANSAATQSLVARLSKEIDGKAETFRMSISFS
jgi:hypothetical protein